MDALGYIKDLSLEESHEFFEEMSESSCYLSMIKGFISEHEFKKTVIERGWLCEKMKDGNQKFRYDFDVLNNRGLYTIEVKLMSSRNQVNANFRDVRHVKLPTGKWWRTKCRHISEDFDYLALHDGINFEFYFVDFSYLRPLEAKDLKETKKHEAVILTDKERNWIRKWYVDGTVKITDFSKCLRFKDIE